MNKKEEKQIDAFLKMLKGKIHDVEIGGIFWDEGKVWVAGEVVVEYKVRRRGDV